MQDFIFSNTIAALRTLSKEPLPYYEAALQAACKTSPPPFGMAWYGEKYRAFASDPGWFAASLIANAEKEGDGARKLWSVAARTPDPEIAEAIRQHAIDESRHALLYIAMCELVFPDSIGADIKPFTNSISPKYSLKDFPASLEKSSQQTILDEIIQMNIGEIRTRLHQLLMTPIITAYCQIGRRESLKKALLSLIYDETQHISYTAMIINKTASEGFDDFVYSTTKKRLAEFNELTLKEVGEENFEVN